MKINTITFSSLVKREVLRFSKVAIQTVFAPLISTGLYLIIFSYSFQNREVPRYGIPYISFIVPGLIMMSLIQNSFANTSSSLIGAKYNGIIIDFLLAPFSYIELSLGFMIGGMVRGLLVGTVTYLVSIYFYGGAVAHPFLALFFAVLVSSIFSLFGIIAGLWAEKFDHVSIFSNFFITPLTFLSGVFYSVKGLPGIWSKVSLFNPVFYMVDAVRYSFVGQSDISPLISALIIGSFALILFVLVTYLFKIGYKVKS
ncbi:ABC-2 type transport system permease protein [Halanaerobium congolense]|jgi:ABC-2 type transport system permease protein|uniref:Transport permease protein n=2 Tax=Halanaerobium congolense TaxID=54121 RepID=A0A1M7LV48_9FIRM|nr:ABC transporter permease [Halanaerobium congolense]KXS48952.1 MAG: antibiotic transport system permease protein [Halanaerobium sp. T82-1]PTX15985.1 ABC-2 type transport system permease protein [Halanaerobium congolense]TDP19811.1 ABC-2 type transport system permease protein [Halanaerobium congolense]TDX46368.1 ABC-2 type transport system permease protein [Halanaerobium congolense]SDF64876.1 ABC-2 type transport system permease protein [Halanaerobium congolense]